VEFILHATDLRRIHMADEKDKDPTTPPAGILGLADAPVSAGEDDEVRAIAPDPSEQIDDDSRHRRGDDVIERQEALSEDPTGGPDPPPGLHVED
jgi:hypothetical protein